MDTPLKSVKISANAWQQGRVEIIRRAHELLWTQIEVALRDGWPLPDETRSLKLVLLASADSASTSDLPALPSSDT